MREAGLPVGDEGRRQRRRRPRRLPPHENVMQNNLLIDDFAMDVSNVVEEEDL